MQDPSSSPKMITLTALAYFNELCAKSSGPISSHEWKNRESFISPIRQCDVFWKGRLIVIMKEGEIMTFYAEASNKKGVEQELARLFLEKAGFTIPKITPKPPKRQVLNLYNMFLPSDIEPQEKKKTENWLRKTAPLTSSKKPTPEEHEKVEALLKKEYKKMEDRRKMMAALERDFGKCLALVTKPEKKKNRYTMFLSPESSSKEIEEMAKWLQRNPAPKIRNGQWMDKNPSPRSSLCRMSSWSRNLCPSLSDLGYFPGSRKEKTGN